MFSPVSFHNYFLFITNLTAISLQPCWRKLFHGNQRPHCNSLAFVYRIIHTAGNPLQFQPTENISHIVNGLRRICCSQVMMNLKWYPGTPHNFPTDRAVFSSTVCYNQRASICRRDISDAILTLSIAFCSKSIQKRVRYLFPAGTLPPSFFTLLQEKEKKTLIPISISPS